MGEGHDSPFMIRMLSIRLAMKFHQLMTPTWNGIYNGVCVLLFSFCSLSLSGNLCTRHQYEVIRNNEAIKLKTTSLCNILWPAQL